MEKLNSVIQLLGVSETLDPGIKALLITLLNASREELLPVYAWDRIKIPTPAGEYLVIPRNSFDLSSVAFVDKTTEEVIYKVTADEIEEDPLLILGSIFGAYLHGAKIHEAKQPENKPEDA